MLLKSCQNCFQEFEDTPYAEATSTPVGFLGEIFLDAVGRIKPDVRDAHQLCPACREKLGIVNILGFGSQ